MAVSSSREALHPAPTRVPKRLGLARPRGRSPVSAAAAVAGLAGAAALAETFLSRRAERLNPPLGQFIRTDGVELHFLTRDADLRHPEGDGDGGSCEVVLLHGAGVMVEDFVISQLFDCVARRRRVVAFDRPGFGHTVRPRDRRWSAEAQASLIHSAFARLGIERPIVVGHSWGTLVALALAVAHPEAVAGLVLVSGYYYPSLRADAALFTPIAVPLAGDLLRHTVAPSIGRVIKPAILRKIFWPLPPSERFKREFPFALALRPSQIRAAAEDAAQMASCAARLAERYAELTMPVVILTGAEDAIVDRRRHAARLHSEIGQSELWVKDGAGHMLHHAAPEWVAGAIDRLAGRIG